MEFIRPVATLGVFFLVACGPARDDDLTSEGEPDAESDAGASTDDGGQEVPAPTWGGQDDIPNEWQTGVPDWCVATLEEVAPDEFPMSGQDLIALLGPTRMATTGWLTEFPGEETPVTFAFDFSLAEYYVVSLQGNPDLLPDGSDEGTCPGDGVYVRGNGFVTTADGRVTVSFPIWIHYSVGNEVSFSGAGPLTANSGTFPFGSAYAIAVRGVTVGTGADHAILLLEEVEENVWDVTGIAAGA